MFASVGAMIAYQKNFLSNLKNKSMQKNTNILLIIFGFFTGALTGVTGLGGGALIVPIFFILTSLGSIIGVFLAGKTIKTIDTKKLDNIITALIGLSGFLLVFYSK